MYEFYRYQNSFRDPLIPLVIVGNKSDLTRSLPFEEIEATVNMDWEAGYVECSAIESCKENIMKIFKELYNQHSRIMETEDNSNDEVFELEKKKPIQVLKRMFSRDNFDLIKRKSSSNMLKKETCKIS